MSSWRVALTGPDISPDAYLLSRQGLRVQCNVHYEYLGNA